MFDDVIHNFRQFFIPTRYGQDLLLELLCYSLYPRYYRPNLKEEYVIYDEGDEVLEIVFIIKGEVGVGFKLQNSLATKRYELTSVLGSQSFFADYYVFGNLKSEFCYIATEEVTAFSISKRSVLEEIFPVFPISHFNEFQARAKARY